MRINLSTSTSETYNINMSTFEDIQPEEFLVLLKNFSIPIDTTVSTSALEQINYICSILHGEYLRQFDELAS